VPTATAAIPKPTINEWKCSPESTPATIDKSIIKPNFITTSLIESVPSRQNRVDRGIFPLSDSFSY